MKRIQRSREAGAKLPAGTLCVTRGTHFGNPFKVKYARENPARVVAEFRQWIHKPEQRWIINEFLQRCAMGDYQYLACWCGLKNECHADVWLDIFNEARSAYGLHGA